MKNYIVYITTNTINGKKYIGSHSTKNIEDGYLGSGVYLSKAIKKHGNQNFIREILAQVDNSENMKELEEYYIEYYSAFLSPQFYNATKYPAGITNNTWGDKIRETNKGNTYNLGKKRSEETKLLMSLSSKGINNLTEEGRKRRSEKAMGNKNALGYKFSQEGKDKIGKAHSKPITQYNGNGEFIRDWNSGADAAEFLFGNRLKNNGISNCCNGRCKAAHGFIWKFKEK